FASSVSPESAELMARMGFGMMIIGQKDWESAAVDIQQYRATAAACGHPVRPVMALANGIVADDPSEARDLARTHLRVYMKTIDDHYRFSDGHLAGLKGYEFYSKMAKTYNKVSAPREDGESAKPADAAKKKSSGDLNVTGTPAEALEKLRY